MHVGVIDLGRNGAAIARRLLAAGRPCVVYDRSPRTVAEIAAERAHGARSVPDLVHELDAPRTIWLAGPATETDATIAELRPLVEPDDVIIDCGESDCADDIRRAADLADLRVHYVDVGICGEIGRPNGCTLTIGGEEAVARSLSPLFEAIASPRGYLYCGPAGAGHFVTLIHNGIERRLMAAYMEGFRMLRAANTAWTDRGPDYEFDLSAIVNVWRQGGAPVASPVMERACREQAAVVEADCGLPQMHR